MEAAVVSFQKMASTVVDMFWLERIDRAIDECVAHPLRTHPAVFQHRGALSNAKKVIDGRRAIRHWQSIGDREAFYACSTSDDGQYDVVDWRLWLRDHSAISFANRRLLLQLADGFGAEDLAKRYGQPVAIMRQRISRARSAARAARALDAA